MPIVSIVQVLALLAEEGGRVIAFATTVHDPDGRLVRVAESLLPRLRLLYSRMVAVATTTTHPDTAELLRADFDQVRAGGDGAIGTGRRLALEGALEGPCEGLHYCDLDRALHWVEQFPLELESVIGKIPDYDYLILGRTDRAFATHPRLQVETEQLTNRVFSLWLGRPVDVTAGSCGLSRKTAELLVNRSREPTNATDCEWPALVRVAGSTRIGYAATEGLEFETGDYHCDDIERAGSYERWLDRLSSDPRLWLSRIRLTYESVEAAVRVASQYNVEREDG